MKKLFIILWVLISLNVNAQITPYNSLHHHVPSLITWDYEELTWRTLIPGDTLPAPHYEPFQRIAREAADAVWLIELQIPENEIWDWDNHLWMPFSDTSYYVIQPSELLIRELQPIEDLIIDFGEYEIRYLKHLTCLDYKSYRKYRKCMCNSIK